MLNVCSPAVVCFLPGRAKDLPAPPRKCYIAIMCNFSLVLVTFCLTLSVFTSQMGREPTFDLL